MQISVTSSLPPTGVDDKSPHLGSVAFLRVVLLFLLLNYHATENGFLEGPPPSSPSTESLLNLYFLLAPSLPVYNKAVAGNVILEGVSSTQL